MLYTQLQAWNKAAVFQLRFSQWNQATIYLLFEKHSWAALNFASDPRWM